MVKDTKSKSKFFRLQLDGGCHVFDFINTVNSRTISAPTDWLNSYEDILQWSGKASILPDKRIKILSQIAKHKKSLKEAAFKKAIRAREILYRLFFAIVQGHNPDKTTLSEFNKLLSISLGKLKLKISSRVTEISFTDSDVSLEEPLRLILKSAYDILTTENIDKLKECKSCGWLFIDRTKNGKRRWCDMKVCGSNDKAKRYYHRMKSAGITNG